jgi:predicted ATPase/DNA-binding SARP family transcriptional activator
MELRPVLRIELFGSLRAWIDDRPLPRPSKRGVEVLWAYLLLHRDVAMPRSRIAFTLWADEPEAAALADLRRFLHRLNALLVEATGRGDWIHHDRRSLKWSQSGEWSLDVAEYEALTRRAPLVAQHGDRATAVADLLRAADLQHAPLLGDLDAEWLEPIRQRLHGQQVRALEVLGQWQEEAGDFAAAVESARRCLALEPVQEGMHRALMRRLHRAGNRTEAMAQFDTCVANLRERFGLEPDPSTVALAEAIREGRTVPGAAPVQAETPARVVPRLTRRVGNLPVMLSRFVGRSQEIAAILQLLDVGRLVTLGGTGGAGKTRLAIEVTGRRIDRSDADVWWVDLAPLNAPSLVLEEVARVLAVPRDDPRQLSERVRARLGAGPSLLVFDNCEHLVDASAEVIGDLLAQCPGVRVLATSRERLGLDGEVFWQVPPLSLPRSGTDVSIDELLQSEAVELFLDRMHGVSPTMEVRRPQLMAIADICRAVDSIPLCIELAAARVAVLSLDDIAIRVGDSMRLLRGLTRDRPSRHQTIEAAVAWSYDLLTVPEQALLRRLAIFAGRFAFAAVEPVCVPNDAHGEDPLAGSDPLDLVARLIDKSLLVTTADDTGTRRYRMLHVIRDFARARLAAAGELDLLSDRHAAHFLDLAARASGEVRGPDAATWFDALDREVANIRAVMDHLQQHGRVEDACRMADALVPFWGYRDHVHLEYRWLTGMLASEQAEAVGADLVTAAHRAAAFLARTIGDLPSARAHAEASVASSRRTSDSRSLGLALGVLGKARLDLGDLAEAHRALEESLAIGEEIGDALVTGNALVTTADTLIREGRFAEARLLDERALGVLSGHGAAARLRPMAFRGLGVASESMGDLHGARRYLEQALAIDRADGNGYSTASWLNSLARVVTAQGDYATAERLLKEALEIFQRFDYELTTAVVLNNLGEVELARGNAVLARVYLDRSLRIKQRFGDTWSTTFTEVNLALLLLLEGDAESAAAVAATCVDRARGLGDPDLLAWALRIVGHANIVRGAIDSAIGPLAEALRLARNLHAPRAIMQTIDLVASVAGARGTHEVAVRLAAAGDALRAAVGLPRTDAEARLVAALVETATDAIGAAAVVRSLEDGRAMTRDEAESLAGEVVGAAG